jgi:GMP synthase (glutamine-hydrolysing)
MKPILILKTGSTFSSIAHEHGDFEDWIIAASGEAPGLFVVADGVEESVPALDQLSGIIITGSHLMVSDGGPLVELWSQLLRDAVVRRLPLLGVCFGHQLLAHALGGVVTDHPGGVELGQVEIEMVTASQDDPLFCVLPAKFSAYASHLQSVQKLPADAFVYGGNRFEPHHAVRFAPAAWGVQFHPEFNQRIMRTYIRHQRPRLKSDEEMESLLNQVEPLPDAGQLLQRFCQLLDN